MDNWEIYYRTHAGKVLTGSPPLSFVSNGQPFSDYRIYGNSGGVGDRTKNLFNINTASPVYVANDGKEVEADRENLTSDSISVTPGEKFVWKAYPTTQLLSWSAVAFYMDNRFVNRIVAAQSTSLSFEVPDGVNRLKIGSRYLQNGGYAQLELGSFATDYEPYGYKIPIVCGETTTNIYLNEPLSEGESISMSDAGISIPTINGSNTLSIGTTVQPSNMYIKYGGSGNINQSLMTYLEYKYNVAKE